MYEIEGTNKFGIYTCCLCTIDMSVQVQQRLGALAVVGNFYHVSTLTTVDCNQKCCVSS